LNAGSVARYLGDLSAADAELSYRRAEVFGQVAGALTPEQKAVLGRMKFGDFNTWPAVEMDQYKLPRGTEKLYSDPVREEVRIPSTDQFFFPVSR
jgi:hypothetical protein